MEVAVKDSAADKVAILSVAAAEAIPSVPVAEVIPSAEATRLAEVPTRSGVVTEVTAATIPSVETDSLPAHFG